MGIPQNFARFLVGNPPCNVMIGACQQSWQRSQLLQNQVADSLIFTDRPVVKLAQSPDSLPRKEAPSLSPSEGYAKAGRALLKWPGLGVCDFDPSVDVRLSGGCPRLRLGGGDGIGFLARRMWIVNVSSLHHGSNTFFQF